MKKPYTVFVIVLFAALMLVVAFSLVYLHANDAFIQSTNEKFVESVKKPNYHFVVIAQSTDDPFWSEVKKGAFEAAKAFNVAVEFNGPRFTNINEELQYLNIAIASKVDGIATHVLDETQFTPVIDTAISKNIPVITIESDAKKSKRLSFIGTNNFQLGSLGGKLMAEATGGNAKVAVVLNSYTDEVGDVAQNLRIAGFRDAVKGFSDKIEIKVIRMSRMGILSAGEITNEIINNYPEINAIFCTNAKDTVGTAQVVVDLNKVGDIKIIGYGDLPEIWRYVDKEVIYGTVVSNPVEMGYESIKALTELKKSKSTSAYVDTGLHGVTRKNLDEYMKKADSKKEQGVSND